MTSTDDPRDPADRTTDASRPDEPVADGGADAASDAGADPADAGSDAAPDAGSDPAERSRAREAAGEWSSRSRASLESALEAAQRGLDQVRAATEEGLASAGQNWDAARAAAHDRQTAQQERRAARSARQGGRQRTYVVTGSAGGIGRATVERLRADGHRVFGVDLHDADIGVDLSTPEGRAELGTEVEERCDGVVDGVVAVAGMVAPVPTTAAVNFFGARATLQELQPYLAGSPAPRAVVVSSLAAIGEVDDELVAACLAGDEQRATARAAELGDAADASGNNFIYSSSKRALAVWARTAAPTDEWAGAGIALNVIAPGVIETDMTRAALGTAEGRQVLSEGSPAPLNGPAAPPEAPAHLLAFLVSEENSYLTGQILFVDGGAEASRRPDRF